MGRALLTGTRSCPFRDWSAVPKLPQFPGWSPIPEHERLFTEFMDLAGVETAYVTDNPFLLGPRFDRSARASTCPGRSISKASTGSGTPAPSGRSWRPGSRLPATCCQPLRGPRRRSGCGRTSGSTGPAGSGTLRARGCSRRGSPLCANSRIASRSSSASTRSTRTRLERAFHYVRRFGRHEGIEPILPLNTPYSKVEEIEIADDQLKRVQEPTRPS